MSREGRCGALLSLAVALAGCSALKGVKPSGAPPSYEYEFATPAKASRVGVAPRGNYGSLEPRGPALPAEAGDPEFVLISPSGEQVVVKSFASAFALVPQGWRELALGEGRTLGAATAQGLAFGNHLLLWGNSGSRGPLAQDWASGFVAERARWTDGVSLIGVYESPRNESSGAELEVLASPIAAQPKGHDPLRWSTRVPGQGTAAVTAEGQVVLVLQDGKVKIFAREGNQGKPRIIAETQTSPAYSVSVVQGAVVVLQALIHDPDSRLPDFPLRSQELPGHWSTRATVLSLSDGALKFTVEVPFEVLQPAIDGGNGQIYLAGRGLAAFNERGLIRQVPSSEILKATAFAEGTLAVSAGTELRILSPQGDLRQSLMVPGSQPITTPPALGPDGAIVVATRERMYWAR